MDMVLTRSDSREMACLFPIMPHDNGGTPETAEKPAPTTYDGRIVDELVHMVHAQSATTVGHHSRQRVDPREQPGPSDLIRSLVAFPSRLKIQTRDTFPPNTLS